MIIELRGGESRAAAGVLEEARAGAYKELIVNDAGLGRYFEANRLGRLMRAATTAAGFTVANATFVAPLAAASTPIIGIFNPQGNTKAAVLLKASVGVLPVGPATTVPELVWVAALPNAGITAAAAGVTFQSLRLDSTAPTSMKGYANAALTGLLNPVAFGTFGGHAAGTVGALATEGLLTDEVEGKIIVPPGAFVGLLVTTLPVAATCNGSIDFAEIDWPL